jgi:SAM-dependent methyltransferase
VWALRRFFPGFRALLEIGCGTGVVLEAVRDAFPSARLTGSELSAAGLCVAAERLRGVALMQMDARAMPFAGAFDVVSAFDVLEHIDEDVAVLQQMAHAAAPGGGVIVSVPQHPWMWSAVDEYGGHVRRYTRPELVEKLSSVGLVVEYATSFMTLVLPAMYAARWRARDAETIDPAAELTIGRVPNALFGALCACEARAVTAGWPLPVGASLLAVARRAA